MEILLCKLITGEEVLGENLGEELNYGKTYIKLKNPVKVATVRGADGNPNVGFAPFPTFIGDIKDQIITFDKEHVIYSYVPAEDFRKNYEQIFGLGLILPGEKQIITG